MITIGMYNEQGSRAVAAETVAQAMLALDEPEGYAMSVVRIDNDGDYLRLAHDLQKSLANAKSRAELGNAINPEFRGWVVSNVWPDGDGWRLMLTLAQFVGRAQQPANGKLGPVHRD